MELTRATKLVIGFFGLAITFKLLSKTIDKDGVLLFDLLSGFSLLSGLTFEIYNIVLWMVG